MRFRAERDENQHCNISIKSEIFWVSPQCEMAGKAGKAQKAPNLVKERNQLFLGENINPN